MTKSAKNTEYRIVIEGIKHGRPFRETNTLGSAFDAGRQMQTLQQRIDNPPPTLTGPTAVILRAELQTRKVTAWTTEQTEGQEPVVDAWLASERYRIHDQGDLDALRKRQQGEKP
jgi:hypothetical protein